MSWKLPRNINTRPTRQEQRNPTLGSAWHIVLRYLGDAQHIIRECLKDELEDLVVKGLRHPESMADASDCYVTAGIYMLLALYVNATRTPSTFIVLTLCVRVTIVSTACIVAVTPKGVGRVTCTLHTNVLHATRRTPFST